MTSNITITVNGTKVTKGDKLTEGAGWRLVATTGQKRYFAATLVGVINSDGKRFALFSVPTRKPRTEKTATRKSARSKTARR